MMSLKQDNREADWHYKEDVVAQMEQVSKTVKIHLIPNLERHERHMRTVA
jgi:hypothetical protein